MERSLADLERFKPALSDPNPSVPGEVITQLRISLARIEGKLDGLINLNVTVTKLREDLIGAETRLTKLESWQKFVLWLAGAVWAVSLAVFGALAFYFIHP